MIPQVSQIYLAAAYTDVDVQWFLTGKTSSIHSLVNAYLPMHFEERMEQKEHYKTARELFGYGIWQTNAREYARALNAAAIYYHAACCRQATLPQNPNRSGTIDDILADCENVSPDPESLLYIRHRLDRARSEYVREDVPGLLAFSEPPKPEVITISQIDAIPIMGYAAADESGYRCVNFLQTKTGEQDIPKQIMAIEIVGNSMAPIILHRQYALILPDPDPDPPNGAIVIAEVHERDGEEKDPPEHYCKRIQIAGDRYYFLSQCPYSSLTFSSRRDKCRIWPVIGVWFGGRGRPPPDVFIRP
ncbi:MAG: S24 family peptidase [Planctomycetota bacterium]|nr:S24 family peptidase [Planctomycetota bacterium]